MAVGKAKCFIGVLVRFSGMMMMNLLVLLCVFFSMFDTKKEFDLEYI